MNKYFFFALTVFLISSIFESFAQYGPILASGRPGNANGAGTTGKGILQFQAGVQYSELSSDLGLINTQSDFSENLVVRYGITERLEFSTVLNHSNVTLKSMGGEEFKSSGFNTTMLRARYRPLNNLAIQIGMNFPLLSNDFDRQYTSPQIKVMYNTVFSDFLNLTTNLGAQWDDPKNDPVGFYVLSLSAALPANFSLLVESYGDFNIYGLRNYYDAGLAYLVNPDLLLDVNAGWGENFGVSSYFVTTGFSYRMKTAWRD